MRLGIIDDDRTRGATMACSLSEAGHVCTQFESGQTLCSILHHERFDLLLFDVDAPGTPAADMLEWIAGHAAGKPPVIVLANPRDVDAPGEWRKLPCEDLLFKPVVLDALKAKVDAVLRRHYRRLAQPSHVEVYGIHAFDPMAMTVTVAGLAIELTAKEFGLALFLFRNLNKPIARAQIMETVWGRVPDLNSRTLDAHISQIRRRLGLRPENGLHLSSVYAFGYRLEMAEPRRAVG